MDANKPVSPRDVYVESTTQPVQSPVTTAASDGQHASAPRVYPGSDALPRFMTGSAPVAHAGLSASAPQGEGHAASGISLQDGSGAASSSSSSSSSSSNQTATSVAQAPQNSHANDLSFVQRHKETVIAAYSLTAREVMGYDKLAASIKANNRSGVIHGFALFDSRKTLTRLLSYTSCSVMADATRTGDSDLLQLLFDEANDANFQDKLYDQMLNGYGDAGGEYLLDIAASRMDLGIGLMLVKKGAKPGPNCPRRFLDCLLKIAIASKSENAMRNLLGYGADWNLFFYSEQRHQFDFIHTKAFLLPAFRFHHSAGNKQAALDIYCLWAGSTSRSNETFDEEIERCASDKNHLLVKELLETRPHVVEADHAKPTAALMRAIQVAASVGTAKTLEILLDHYMSVRTERGDANRSSKAPDRMADNTPLPSQLLDMKDQTGRTLLHLAAQSGNAKTIALLLERGAKLRELDGEKQWALTIAVKGKHTAAAVFLLRAALAATDSWPGKKAMIRAAVSHADPAMKAALMNVHNEVQPGPPAKVAARPYEPHWDL
jgi:ankyrin repeat protein